jgi:hypothetical protein
LRINAQKENRLNEVINPDKSYGCGIANAAIGTVDESAIFNGSSADQIFAAAAA